MLFCWETESALDVPAKETLDLSFEIRVHEIAKECDVRSPVVASALRHLGFKAKSASSKVRFEPMEYMTFVNLIKDGRIW